MKKQVFYIHGGEAFSDHAAFLEHLQTKPIREPRGQRSEKRWTDELRPQLQDAFEVFCPAMPNSDNAKYIEWKIWFERHFEFLTGDVVLIGWSQGGMFLAKYLTENDVPFTIAALFLLAAPYEFFVINGEDGGDFYPDIEQIPTLQEKVGHITIMHSKDDFVVPYEHALKYKDALPSAELVTFTDKNHFLIEAFPELIERLRSLA